MRNRKVAARRLLTNSLVHAVVGALGQGMLGAVQEWKNSDRRGRAAWTRPNKALKLGTVRGWQGTPGQGMAVARPPSHCRGQP